MQSPRLLIIDSGGYENTRKPFWEPVRRKRRWTVSMAGVRLRTCHRRYLDWEAVPAVVNWDSREPYDATDPTARRISSVLANTSVRFSYSSRPKGRTITTLIRCR